MGNAGYEFFGRNIPDTVITVGVVILAVTAVITAVILKETPFARHVLLIGGNEKVSKLSGDTIVGAFVIGVINDGMIM